MLADVTIDPLEALVLDARRREQHGLERHCSLEALHTIKATAFGSNLLRIVFSASAVRQGEARRRRGGLRQLRPRPNGVTSRFRRIRRGVILSGGAQRQVLPAEATDKVFAGPVPEIYERLLVPLLFHS